jgi:parallel beta-helix repeat protein
MKSFLRYFRSISRPAAVSISAPRFSYQQARWIGGGIAFWLGLFGHSLAAIANSTPIGGATGTPFEQYSGTIDYTVISKSLTSVPACGVAASATSTLTVPTGATIKKAYLYWSGSGTNPGASPTNIGTATGGIDNSVTFNGSVVTATTSWEDQAAFTFGGGNYKTYYYGARADVTSQVTGSGSYTVGGINSIPGNSIGPSTYCDATAQTAGWALIVIYEKPGLQTKTVALFEGFNPLKPADGTTTPGGSATVNLTGFRASTGSVISKTTPLVWQGDNGITGDTLNINAFAYSATGKGGTADNNVFNGSGTNQTAGSEFAVDADMLDISSYVKPGDTNLALQFGTSANDLLVLQAVVIGATIDPDISGTVFEDVNYGGGSGRSIATAGTSAVGRDGATVELYSSTGTYLQSTTTSGGGKYTFSGIPPGDYFVRVVNSTVTSSRPGSVNTLLPVQTFRVNDSTGTPADDLNRVGGEKPAVADTGAAGTGAVLETIATNTKFSFKTAGGSAVAGGQAESIAPVKLGVTNVTGIDFGYNFDTIVNTKDSGQGSLRQFIINSNALTNTGNETSIFMISDGLAHNGLAAGLTNQLSSYGAAIVTLASPLPTISDSNTVIDGATQTANIGDTNVGTLGAGGIGRTVGTDAIPLPLFNRPEVEIRGGQSLLTATGNYDQIKNIAADLHLAVSGTGAIVQDNLVGMEADGSIITTLDKSAYAINVSGGSNITARHNYVRVNDSGIRTDGSGTGLLIEFNEVDAPPLSQTDTFEGILLIGTGDKYTVQKNLIQNMRGAGTELAFYGTLTNILLENNTYVHNGYEARGGTVSSTEPIGIVAYNGGAGQVVISKNIITQSAGAGIVVMGSQGITITRNSIYTNGVSGTTGLGIDLDSNSRDPNKYGTADGITANNGSVLGSLPNKGIDYPVITSSKLVGGTLTVKGYVGDNTAASNSAFGTVKLEFFIAAADDGNQNGAVILGDGRSKLHAEGQTYLGTCTTDSNSQFSCTFSTAGTLGLTDSTKITATATDASGNTSEFSASPYNPANVQIVKRITGIKSAGGSYGTTNPNNTSIALNPIDNTNPSFPANYVVGASNNAGIVKPGDEIEYTVYYVNNGENAAKLKVCDLLAPNLVFNSDGFDTGTNTGHGIQLQLGQNTPVLLTSANDSTVDRAYYANGAPGATISGCNLAGNTTTTTTTNASGTVVIDINSASASDTSAPILLTIPGTVGATIPNDSYGFFKFRAKVKN